MVVVVMNQGTTPQQKWGFFSRRVGWCGGGPDVMEHSIHLSVAPGPCTVCSYRSATEYIVTKATAFSTNPISQASYVNKLSSFYKNM